MRECEHTKAICDCIDWKQNSSGLWVSHLVSNFEFTGFEFEYTSLEAAEERRLCKVGRCRICGKRMCYSGTLPSDVTGNGLLLAVYRKMHQMWNGPRDKIPDSFVDFHGMFFRAFHEADHNTVRKWLLEIKDQGFSILSRYESREDT